MLIDSLLSLAQERSVAVIQQQEGLVKMFERVKEADTLMMMYNMLLWLPQQDLSGPIERAIEKRLTGLGIETRAAAAAISSVRAWHEGL